MRDIAINAPLGFRECGDGVQTVDQGPIWIGVTCAPVNGENRKTAQTTRIVESRVLHQLWDETLEPIDSS
jgi:hypothetical protein